MVDLVQQQYIQRIIEQIADSSVAPPSVPKAEDVSRFAAALARQNEGVTPILNDAAQIEPAAKASSDATEKSESPMNAILHAFNSARQEFDASRTRIEELFSKSNLSAGDYLKVQDELMGTLLRQELTAKLAGAVTKSADQLLKG